MDIWHRQFEPNSRKIFRRPMFVLALSGLLAITCLLPGAHAQNLRTTLVMDVDTAGLVVLPDSTLDVVSGTGLQQPSINRSALAPGGIVLWDEMSPTAQQLQFNESGTSTITVNSPNP